MKNDPLLEADRWLEQARYDLKSAIYCEEGERYYLSCFLSQQVGEKALKAFFYARGERRVLGHSVNELCRKAAQIEPTFTEFEEDAAQLDRFYIPTRYPNGLPGGIPAESFYEKDAKSAISMAEKIFEHVDRLIYVLKAEKEEK